MKLKRLEIIGFKSFADKTVLSFEKEITAIVGPNGCGKSNVVDSIRWVMGEMSAKHLRGKSMEDIIFSGSDKRAPLSMGSVELTFSTEGYQTPVNYLNHSEISIGRRLYRTGESEYFINKTPVRHKDVIDLFLGTGVGTKAYSIIEQGRISQIITAKPEERRYYIEEVAGISKFKSRKEAALRKMEATQQNLLRLNDIVAELERQLKTLERQAKKAEKYKVVKEELTKLDLGLLSTNYSIQNNEQLQKEEALKEASINEAGIQSNVLQMENEIETTRNNLLLEEEEIQNLQNSVFEITNYIGLAETRLRYKKEENQKTAVEKENLALEKSEIQTRYQNTRQALFDQDEKNLDILFEEAALKEQVEFLEKEVEEKGTLFSELKQEEETLKEKSYKLESRLSQIETIKKNLLDKKHELTQNLETQSAELYKVEIQFKEMTKLHKELEGNLVSLKQLKLDLNTKTDNLALELASHKENLKNLEKDLASFKEELTLRQSRLSSLIELQRNFEGYQEGPRSVLLKKDEIAKDAIFGTVADFVETEPRFEGAVSAVLGEKLQYVVVKSQETGLHASEYLSAQSSGRSSFVPMGLRNYESESSDIPDQPGVLGPLSRFVKLRENYENLSPFLFGDVVLVEDLKKALNLWETNGHRKTLVTLNGEVVDPTGVITGGTLANTSKALLEKKREMKELEELISNLQTSVAERELERLNFEARVETLSNALESIKNSRLEEEIKITHQEKDLLTFKKDIETLLERQNGLKAGIAEKTGTLQNIEPELTALDSEQSELSAQKTGIEARLPEIKNAFENIKVTFENQKQALTEGQIRLAKVSQALSYAKNSEEQTLDLICKLRMEEAQKEAKISNLTFTGEFLKKEILHIEKVLGKKMEKAARIKENLQNKKESFETKNSFIRQKESELKVLREDFAHATKALNEITLQLSEVRNSLKHIVEQALERYNLILADVYEKFLDPNLPVAETQKRVSELRDQMSRIGDVNTEALTEFEETQKRHQFLSTQKVDLENSLSTLEKVIHKINRTTRERFMATFDAVNAKFQEVFPKLFRGGKAHLQLTDETNLLETGVEIAAQPPGKKLQTINLLSGGEKALTAISLVFSIFQIKPSPFCILDEVDAPLDEANVERYNEMIRLMTDRTQFIVITHNKRTMQMCDALYGITMPEPGISQMVSVDLGK